MENGSYYKQLLEDLQSDLDECLSELRQNQNRKANLEQAISGVQGLLKGNEEEVETTGLTNAVRKLFSAHPKVRGSAITVRVGLKKYGFPIEDYTQPLAVIHTTLRRLAKQGELEPKEIEGTTHYRWVGEEEE